MRLTVSATRNGRLRRRVATLDHEDALRVVGPGVVPTLTVLVRLLASLRGGDGNVGRGGHAQRRGSMWITRQTGTR